MNKYCFRSAILLLLSCTVTFVFASEISKEPTVTLSGCKRPAVVGVVEEKSITYASSAVDDFQKGSKTIQHKKKVIDAFSNLAKDSLIIDYQVCLARKRHRYNRIQAEWLRKLLLYMRTKPTAAQFDKWQKENPFPTRLSIKFFNPCKNKKKKCKVLIGDEIRALVEDKTFTTYNVLKNRKFYSYDTADGRRQFRLAAGGRIKYRFWRINRRGRVCYSRRRITRRMIRRWKRANRQGRSRMRRRFGKCFLVVSMGKGIYHLYRRRQHIRTWSHFRTGKHL